MKQEIIAGIIFGRHGTEHAAPAAQNAVEDHGSMENKRDGEPSDTYIVLMRVLGIVFAAVGGGLLIWG